MANRTYTYLITWCWKDEGNKPDAIAEVTELPATTVQRAISKLVKQLQEGSAEDEDLRASDLMVIDVRCPKLDEVIANKLSE